ncbi:uncharacterized protein LOC129592653 [Paramacrobiotus metropolitanus]|uniref:uncharacterized protein LOC129592653 n=1 Tax=Paramacrobiotus metropolitanus TaxID=2943436 RepID=UPI002445C5E1|nr:uncharacterized protein LOC129592653 [Paramacrobiotus metropolitanus]
MQTVAAIFTFIILQLGGSVGTPLNTTLKLETDCHPPHNPTAKADAAPLGISSFRKDNLTATETRLYEQMRSNDDIPAYQTCLVETRHGYVNRWKVENVNESDTSYVDLQCHTTARRDAVAYIAKNISVISPLRALTVQLADREYEPYDPSDLTPVHQDVFEPIRNQVIQIDIIRCYAPNITALVFEVGILPNLVALSFQEGRNLVIHKGDFFRMPNIRMIYFTASSIQEVEPYTFTDLANLQSLTLERDVDLFIEGYNHCAPLMSWKCMNEQDMANIKKLHCDCSYAWYRNFLKKKPYLTKKRESGEVLTFGDYKTPSKFWFPLKEGVHVLNVDCAGNLTHVDPEIFQAWTSDNYYTGNENTPYSYNVSCYDLPCN